MAKMGKFEVIQNEAEHLFDSVSLKTGLGDLKVKT